MSCGAYSAGFVEEQEQLDATVNDRAKRNLASKHSGGGVYEIEIPCHYSGHCLVLR